MTCTCSKYKNMSCLDCIMESQRSAVDIVMLKAYEDLIMNKWDGERKFNRDELAVVKYCAERNLHPSN